jgi:ZIP family zinc transporter
MTSLHPVALGGLGSLGAGLASGLGAAAVLFVRRLSPRAEDCLLGGAAGIMLAATFFSLLLPGLEAGASQTGSEAAALLLVGTGLMAGALALWGVHRALPHEHFGLGREGPAGAALRRIWLFVIAITIHNFPEGMAVGVAYAAGPAAGFPVALGIGLQNVPEGLAVAVSLLAVGYTRGTAFLVGLATGLVEPVGGVAAAAVVWLAAPALPFVLGLAAGAMLFIISGEVIPETHRRGNRIAATFSLMTGFLVMMALDVAFG